MSNIHNMFLNKYKWYSEWHHDPRHTSWHWTALVIAALFFGSITSLAITSYSRSLDLTAAESNKALALQNASSYNKLSEVTVRLLELSQEYEMAGNKNQALSQIKRVIEERNRAIEESAKSDPGVASTAILDEKTLNTIHEDVRNLLEKKVSIEGNLIITHEDGDNVSKFEYLIETPNGKIIKIYPSNNSALANLGSHIVPKKVKVEGDLVGEAIIASDTSTTEISGATVSSLITPTVIKRTAIILFNWQNDTSQPLSQDQARSGYFTSPTSAAAYHSENSFGKIAIQGKSRVDGDVLGYYTIPYSNGTCGDWTRVWSWGDAAISAAQAQGYNMSGYDLVTFVFPRNTACGWAGYQLVWGGSGSPVTNRNYINGLTSFTTSVNGHEIGHTLGPNHAGKYQCTDASGVPAAIGPAEKCSFAEYGDPFDVMGNSSLSSHMNSAHKNMLSGIFTSSNIRTVTTSGIYTIAPIEVSTTEVQMIKIPRAKVGTTVYDNLYLTYRQPIGFDTKLSQYTVVKGVSIHIGECTSPYVKCTSTGASTVQRMTMLLDNTPGDNNFLNSALTVGNTFTDPTFGITIKTLAISSSSATVEITTLEPACTRANPTVTISPSSQWTYAGYTLNYTVNVKNNNNDSCAPTTYNITGSLPVGWTQSPASVTVSPGGSANATISITSSIGSPAGIYGFNQIARDSENSSYFGTGSSSYNISVSDVTPPTVVISSPSNGSTMPTKGKLDISASASDTSGIASINIYIDGKVVKTCTLVTSCTHSWNLNGKIAKGTHVIKVTATDKAPVPNSAETSVSVINK